MAEIVSVEPAKGRSRKDWKLVAVESVADGLSLRKAGQQWFHHMETDGAYGDELSLQSAAHLFVRPIRVIGEDPEKDRLFQPPESISADCWGAPVFLSYVAFNHFEATEPLRVKEELPA